MRSALMHLESTKVREHCDRGRERRVLGHSSPTDLTRLHSPSSTASFREGSPSGRLATRRRPDAHGSRDGCKARSGTLLAQQLVNAPDATKEPRVRRQDT